MEKIYRITAVSRVETDIISNVVVSLIGRSVIVVIRFVNTFKIDAIVFISDARFLMYQESKIHINFRPQEMPLFLRWPYKRVTVVYLKFKIGLYMYFIFYSNPNKVANNVWHTKCSWFIVGCLQIFLLKNWLTFIL